MMISSITIRELKKKIGQIPLIDIRSIESYNNNHIPTAINITFEQLIIYPDKFLNKNNDFEIVKNGEFNIKPDEKKDGFYICKLYKNSIKSKSPNTIY